MAQSHGARLTKSLGRNLRRRGALPALIASLGIGMFLAFEQLVTAVVDQCAGAQLWEGYGLQLLTITLPFLFGVFVSLWMLAPLSDELLLRFVVARAVLATAIGALMVLLMTAVLSVAGFFEETIRYTGGFVPLVFETAWGSFLRVLVGIGADALQRLPLVLLACVFLWLWWRAGERPHAVSGILDEV